MQKRPTDQTFINSVFLESWKKVCVFVFVFFLTYSTLPKYRKKGQKIRSTLHTHNIIYNTIIIPFPSNSHCTAFVLLYQFCHLTLLTFFFVLPQCNFGDWPVYFILVLIVRERYIHIFYILTWLTSRKILVATLCVSFFLSAGSSGHFILSLGNK